MAARTYYCGANAKIYYAIPAADEGDVDDRIADILAGSEIDNIRDVTLTLEKDESDITMRQGGGWKATWGCLKRCTVEFTLVCNKAPASDVAYLALRDAFFNTVGSDYVDGMISLAVMSNGKVVGSKSRGPVGDFYVTGFNRNEPTEGVITVDVTAKLNQLYGYHIVADA